MRSDLAACRERSHLEYFNLSLMVDGEGGGLCECMQTSM